MVSRFFQIPFYLIPKHGPSMYRLLKRFPATGSSPGRKEVVVAIAIRDRMGNIYVQQAPGLQLHQPEFCQFFVWRQRIERDAKWLEGLRFVLFRWDFCRDNFGEIWRIGRFFNDISTVPIFD